MKKFNVMLTPLTNVMLTPLTTFTRTDGSTGNSADIWFTVDKAHTIATERLPETAAIAALPDLQYLVRQFCDTSDLATANDASYDDLFERKEA